MVGLNTQLPVRTSMEGIPVEVRRSKRRRTRIGLAFDPAGYVIVEAPLDASSSEIRRLIREHRRWLCHRLDKVANTGGLTSCLNYATGELVHFLGAADCWCARAARPGCASVSVLRRPVVNWVCSPIAICAGVCA
ncbi:MAG: hypothetical protein U5Q16_11120 [Gammaproteobacteria bacterium]|nr:hypothetical protein [Gammaproteobacteria bacterium]